MEDVSAISHSAHPHESVCQRLGRPRAVANRSDVRTLNLAVSGADAESLLNDAATATEVSQIDSETELVLFPWLGSQMQVAERLRPARVACWIGNNDALGAVVAFDHLDASQLTPVPDFMAQFTEIADRLQAMGSAVVFGTIPDVTRIAFLIDRADLIRFLGSDFGLPDSSRTSLTALVLVKLGLSNPAIFSNPDFVLMRKSCRRYRRTLMRSTVSSAMSPRHMAWRSPTYTRPTIFWQRILR